jgi:hypothetical protein
MDPSDTSKTRRRGNRPGDPYGWGRPRAEVLGDLAPPPDASASVKASGGLSLAGQIDCVTREVALRENSYPKQIAAGRLTEAEATRKIARMRAVLDTLISLQRMVNSLPH